MFIRFDSQNSRGLRSVTWPGISNCGWHCPSPRNQPPPPSPSRKSAQTSTYSTDNKSACLTSQSLAKIKYFCLTHQFYPLNLSPNLLVPLSFFCLIHWYFQMALSLVLRPLSPQSSIYWTEAIVPTQVDACPRAFGVILNWLRYRQLILGNVAAKEVFYCLLRI